MLVNLLPNRYTVAVAGRVPGGPTAEMNKNLVLLQIALVALLAGCRKSLPSKQQTIPTAPIKEYWIGTNSNTRNLGTSDQPFDGSTREKYDKLIHSIRGPCVIHLSPGIFWTWGTYGTNYLNPGVQLVGAGMTNTVIRLATNCPPTISAAFLHVICNHFAWQSNSAVSDLTVDGNYPEFVLCGRTNLHVNGVTLCGTHQRISRVTATNLFVGTNIPGVNNEGWSLTIITGGAVQTNACEGEVIEDCVVTKFYGAIQTDGIALNSDLKTKVPISGIIRSNTVTRVTEAFNGAWMVNTRITGNFVYNCYDGLYGDTGAYSNLVVSANIFENVTWCARFPRNGKNSLRRDNLTFANNYCAIRANGAMVAVGNFGVASAVPPFFNLTIVSNTVEYAPGPRKNARFITVKEVKGLKIASNTISSAFAGSVIANCSSVAISNNVNFTGTPYRLPQTAR